MSQKLGFPYFGTGLTAIIFLIFGTLLSALYFIIYAALGAGLISAAVRFIGIFLTGWALIGFSVNKDLLPMQRLIATFFALLALVSMFYLPNPIVSFGFNVA